MRNVKIPIGTISYILTAAVLLFLMMTVSSVLSGSPISPILLENFIPYFPWVRPGDGNDINYQPTDLRPPRPPTTNQHNHLGLHHICYICYICYICFISVIYHSERFWIFLTTSVITSVSTLNSQHWLTMILNYKCVLIQIWILEIEYYKKVSSHAQIWPLRNS